MRDRRKTFTVKCKWFDTIFPISMLHHDQCWPFHGIDVGRITGRTEPFTEITLATDKADAPTVDKWASFGWTVIVKEKE